MEEPVEQYEHAGVVVQIMLDTDSWAQNPLDNDNVGTLYSWAGRDFGGDERIGVPDLQADCPQCDGEGTVGGSDEPTALRYDQRTCPRCEGDGFVSVSLTEYMRHHYNAVLTIPLWFDDYGVRGSQIYESDEPNCALCFTQEEIETEWKGNRGAARRYGEARIKELDQWMRGDVYGIVIRDPEAPLETLESVWGFIGEPYDEYIRNEAKAMAEACAQQLTIEHAEQYEWACRDVVTVP